MEKQEQTIKVEEISRVVKNGDIYLLVKEIKYNVFNSGNILTDINYLIRVNGAEKVVSSNYVIIKAIWDSFWSII